ncbi:MAG: hypothetical protein HGA31_04790 [Candidatus Moranbacteria bacterium]|nr:hypothetical protein [Candidatus Moranbacteria bacterium]
MPLDIYSRMGDEKFNQWIFSVLQKTYGSENFHPGPTKGMDGGIDAEYVYGDGTRFPIQIKWRDVTRSSNETLRPKVLKDIRDWVVTISEKTPFPAKVLFITNVDFSGKEVEEIKQIKIGANFTLDFWHFPNLVSYTNQYPDIFETFNPYLTKEDVQFIRENDTKARIKNESRYLKVVEEGNIKHIQSKLKNLFIDFKKQEDLFLGFIFLLEPYYLDDRGSGDREIVRKLFDVGREKEVALIESLRESGSISIIGSLVFVIDRDKARHIVTEGIESLEIEIEQLLDLFIKK